MIISQRLTFFFPQGLQWSSFVPEVTCWPPDIANALKVGKALTATQRREMIRLIVDGMIREDCLRDYQLKAVAAVAVEKYSVLRTPFGNIGDSEVSNGL